MVTEMPLNVRNQYPFQAHYLKVRAIMHYLDEGDGVSSPLWQPDLTSYTANSYPSWWSGTGGESGLDLGVCRKSPVMTITIPCCIIPPIWISS